MSLYAMDEATLVKARAALARAHRIAALTGAGVSIESGFPIGRDARTGLWEKYSVEDLSTPQAYQRNPELVWEWYTRRREMATRAEPNAGHFALAALQRRTPEFTLMTQAIDGLHARAGSRDVIELYGNVLVNLGFDDHLPIDDDELDDQIPPRRKSDGQLARPGVVWLYEPLPEAALAAAWQAASTCEVYLSIGTATMIEPAALLPLLLPFVALQAGATVIEINPEPTLLTPRATHVLPGPAAEVLPLLISE